MKDRTPGAQRMLPTLNGNAPKSVLGLPPLPIVGLRLFWAVIQASFLLVVLFVARLTPDYCYLHRGLPDSYDLINFRRCSTHFSATNFPRRFLFCISLALPNSNFSHQLKLCISERLDIYQFGRRQIELPGALRCGRITSARRALPSPHYYHIVHYLFG